VVWVAQDALFVCTGLKIAVIPLASGEPLAEPLERGISQFSATPAPMARHPAQAP